MNCSEQNSRRVSRAIYCSVSRESTESEQQQCRRINSFTDPKMIVNGEER